LLLLQSHLLVFRFYSWRPRGLFAVVTSGQRCFTRRLSSSSRSLSHYCSTSTYLSVSCRFYPGPKFQKMWHLWTLGRIVQKITYRRSLIESDMDTVS